MLTCVSHFLRIIYNVKRNVFILLATTLGSVSVAHADSNPQGGAQSCSNTNDCLRSIVANTYQALVRIDNVPEQLKNISATALSWIASDDSKTSATLASNFSALGAAINSNNDTQLSIQKQLAQQTFAPNNPNAFTNPSPQNPQILRTIPNINDMNFSSLLGAPPVPKASTVGSAPYNYIKNAAGLNIYHTVPSLTWPGDRNAIPKYYNYYAATMAVATFNAYALSNLYADNQSGLTFTNLQKSLISEASDSSWLTTILSEDLGKVLRQLLLFQSQSYVLLTQLVQIERQILTAQVMGNTLRMLNNQSQEDILVPKAKGEQPT